MGSGTLSGSDSLAGSVHLFGALEHPLESHSLLTVPSHILLFYLLKTLIVLMVLFLPFAYFVSILHSPVVL